jgi:hypothetical protein
MSVNRRLIGGERRGYQPDVHRLFTTFSRRSASREDDLASAGVVVETAPQPEGHEEFKTRQG